MNLSRTGSYAVQAMVYIARRDDAGPPIIGRVAAKALRIPEGFLFRILIALSRAGVLRSLRGRNGGYNLGRPAQTITLLEIIEAVDGRVGPRPKPSSRPPIALDKKLEAAMIASTDIIRKHFAGVTLAELAAGKKAR